MHSGFSQKCTAVICKEEALTASRKAASHNTLVKKAMRPHIILSTFSQAVQHWSIVYRCSGCSAVVHLRSATSSQWYIFAVLQWTEPHSSGTSSQCSAVVHLRSGTSSQCSSGQSHFPVVHLRSAPTEPHSSSTSSQCSVPPSFLFLFLYQTSFLFLFFVRPLFFFFLFFGSLCSVIVILGFVILGIGILAIVIYGSYMAF